MPHQTSSGGQASVSQAAPEQLSARLLVDCMVGLGPTPDAELIPEQQRVFEAPKCPTLGIDLSRI